MLHHLYVGLDGDNGWRDHRTPELRSGGPSTAYGKRENDHHGSKTRWPFPVAGYRTPRDGDAQRLAPGLSCAITRRGEFALESVMLSAVDEEGASGGTI